MKEFLKKGFPPWTGTKSARASGRPGRSRRPRRARPRGRSWAPRPCTRWQRRWRAQRATRPPCRSPRRPCARCYIYIYIYISYHIHHTYHTHITHTHKYIYIHTYIYTCIHIYIYIYTYIIFIESVGRDISTIFFTFVSCNEHIILTKYHTHTHACTH